MFTTAGRGTTFAIASALDQLSIQLRPKRTKTVPVVDVPKRLATIREGLAAGARDDAHHSFTARLLGWVDDSQITDAGRRLLDATPESDDEATAFALALLENPPLSTITSELLLGEWLELRELAPELVRVVGLSEGRARWLVPGLLAWRDELRARGWVARRVAEHLRARTKWMDGLSVRGRDVLGKLGIFTREAVIAMDLAPLRSSNRCRPETVDDIQRFRAQLSRPVNRPRAIEVREPVRVRVEEPRVDPSRAVQAAALALLGRRGCASIAALARECESAGAPKLDLTALRRVLEDQHEIHWLDEDTGWFWSPTLPDNPLVARVSDVLADAGEIDVIELRSTLARTQGDAPPPPVLAALCEQTDDFELSDDGARVHLAGAEPASPVIDEDTTIAELAVIAQMTVEQVVALAMGESMPARRRGAKRSTRG